MRVKISFLKGLLLVTCLSLAVNAATREELLGIELAIILNSAMPPEELVILLTEQKPELAEDILAGVMKAHPDKAATIAQAAISSAPADQVETLLFVAINSGLDPTQVSEATAAGGAPSEINEGIKSEVECEPE